MDSFRQEWLPSMGMNLCWIGVNHALNQLVMLLQFLLNSFLVEIVGPSKFNRLGAGCTNQT